MILIALIHISDTERNISVNIGKAVTINAVFTGFVLRIGITIYKTAFLIKTSHGFAQAVQ
jgi:hypothetical protein